MPKRYRKASQSRFIKKRKGAKAQSKQIMTLHRQVKALRADTTHHAQWTMPLEGATGNSVDLVDGQFYVSSLVRPFAYQPLFQSTILSGIPTAPGIYFTAQRARLNSMSFSIVFSPTDSLIALAPRMLNFYILKLKDETASDVLQKTTGMSTAGLNAAAALNSNLVLRDDLAGGLSTLIRWNPAAFEVKYQKTLKIANIVNETILPPDPAGVQDVPITNTHDALRRFHFNVKMGLYMVLPP